MELNFESGQCVRVFTNDMATEWILGTLLYDLSYKTDGTAGHEYFRNMWRVHLPSNNMTIDIHENFFGPDQDND